MFLTSSLARQTAEALWGRGGTKAYKTNRKGAYYFSCSGHGGFVISAEALSADEYNAISEFVKPEILTVYVANDDDRVLLAFHPYRRNSGKLRGYGPNGYRVVEEKIFLLEEDCNWALAVKFAGITTKDMVDDIVAHAETTFYNQFDDRNPAVVARKLEQKLRAEGDSDLIIAASAVSDGVVKVWTADEKIHYVRGYDKSRDEFNTPWLSRCEVVEMELA